MTSAQTTIADLTSIERAAELPKLLRLCAARTATELNVAALGSELGLSARITDGYVSLLATAFLVHLIPAWSSNLSSKVVRRPKLVLTDSGLAAHMVGASPATIDVPGNNTLGQLLETFVADELRKQITWSDTRPTLWHFRDRGGAEVDLVLEHPDGRVVGIEVKATSTPTASDLRGLRFMHDRLGDRFAYGILLSAAPEATPFGTKLAALPVSAMWS